MTKRKKGQCVSKKSRDPKLRVARISLKIQAADVSIIARQNHSVCHVRSFSGYKYNHFQGANTIIFRVQIQSFSGCKYNHFQGANTIIFRVKIQSFSGCKCDNFQGANTIIFRVQIQSFSGCKYNNFQCANTIIFRVQIQSFSGSNPVLNKFQDSARDNIP